jgi:hypothetical protein
MRCLVIGESGDEAWQFGPSSQRLWRWFGVDSYASFCVLADLDNVSHRKGECSPTTARVNELRVKALAYDPVFLVGKKAQLYVGRIVTQSILWRWNRFVGLPHPSGLNRQLNDLDELTIVQYVHCCMEEVEHAR